MVSYLKYVRPHLKAMANHHARHKGQFLKLLHVIRRHPGAYRPGFKPSRAAMPKSFPKKPAGLHKEASGMWDWARKGWDWVKSKFHKHKGAVIEHAKKVGKQVASDVYKRVGASATRVKDKIIDKATQVAENNINHYVDKAERKIEQVGAKVDQKISKWDKPKKGSVNGVHKPGSGYVSDIIARGARAVGNYTPRARAKNNRYSSVMNRAQRAWAGRGRPTVSYVPQNFGRFGGRSIGGDPRTWGPRARSK